MRVWWMRHGATEWNLVKRIQGRQDIPLHEVGKTQMMEAAKNLGQTGMDWDVVIASPLKRAHESAQILAAYYNVPLKLEPAFVERGFGILEGKNKAEWLAVTGGKNPEQVDDGRLGVESFSELQKRLESGIMQLRACHANAHVLVVTHGSVIRQLGQFFNEPVGMIKNASWIEFKGEKASAYLYSGR